MKILIKKDIYNICSRIKTFDRSYQIVYDTMLNKYQVYSCRVGEIYETISNQKLSYVCTIPFIDLDMRTIKYLYDTQIDNIEMIIKRLDENNQQLEQINQNKLTTNAIEFAEYKLRQFTK